MRLPASINRFFGRTLEVKSPPVPSSEAAAGRWADIFTLPNTEAGPAVTPETAWRVPAVRGAVNLISTTLARMPAKAFRRAGDGKEPATDLPAHELVHGMANPWTTARALRRQITVDAMLHGDGFALVTRRPDGSAMELFRLDPRAVERKQRADGEPFYVYRSTAGAYEYAHGDVLRISAPSLDGERGYPVITAARQAIGAAIAMEGHAARIFSKAAKPSGVLTSLKQIGAETAKRLSRIMDDHAGPNSGGTVVLEDGVKWTPTTLTSVDQQFLQLREFQIVEIARAFGIPPVLLGDLSSATFKNVEELGRQFATYTLAHWLTEWEDAYQTALIAPEDRANTFIDFTLDALLAADLATRAEAYAKQIAARVLSPNEARAIENRPGFDGGDEFVNPYTTSAHAAPTERAAA